MPEDPSTMTPRDRANVSGEVSSWMVNPPSLELNSHCQGRLLNARRASANDVAVVAVGHAKHAAAAVQRWRRLSVQNQPARAMPTQMWA